MFQESYRTFELFVERPYPTQIIESGSTRHSEELENLFLRDLPENSSPYIEITGGILREFPEDYAKKSLVRAICSSQNSSGDNIYLHINLEGDVLITPHSLAVSEHNPLTSQRWALAEQISATGIRAAVIKREENGQLQHIISYLEVKRPACKLTTFLASSDPS